MKLEKDRRYQAKAKLSLTESLFASNDALKLLLVKEGFRDVVVTGSGTDRQATGIWNKATVEKKLPKQITEITAV